MSALVVTSNLRLPAYKAFCMARPSRTMRRVTTVRAAAQRPEQGEGVMPMLQAMLQRYDFVSAGLGALAVTSVCVANGQQPGVALSITAAATVRLNWLASAASLQPSCPSTAWLLPCAART